MEKVTTLVAQLIKTKIPTALQKKIDKLTEVKNSINSLKPVNEADLTDELKIEIEELEQFATELETPILEQLQLLVDEEKKHLHQLVRQNQLKLQSQKRKITLELWLELH